MVTENDEQDCGGVTADDDVRSDEGVSDKEQTLVEFHEEQTTKQAASKLVAQLSEGLSAQELTMDDVPTVESLSGEPPAKGVDEGLAVDVVEVVAQA